MRLLNALVIMSFAGFVWGIFYYYIQLVETNPLLWMFVIDCPLYTLLFGIILIFAAIGLKNKLANAIIATGATKYSIWTNFMLAYYNEYFFQGEIFLHSAALFIAHFALFVGALLLIGNKMSKTHAIIVLGWFLLCDYVDYAMGTAPYLPKKEPIAMYSALALTFCTTSFVYFANKKKINFFYWNKTLTNLRREIIKKE